MTIDAAAIILLALASLVGLVALVLLVMAGQIELPPKDKGKAGK